MLKHSDTRKSHARFSCLRGIVTLGVLVTVAAYTAGSTNWAADAFYILSGSEDPTIILNGDTQIESVEVKLVQFSGQTESYDITLSSGTEVTVLHGGDSITATARQERVSTLLSRLHVSPAPLEMVSVDLSNPNHAVITVDEEITYYEKEITPAAYATVRSPNDDLPEGTEQLIQKGVDGESVAVYEVVWSCGEKISRQLVEAVSNSAIDEIIEYSTADSNADAALAHAEAAKAAAKAAEEAVSSANAEKAAQAASQAEESAKAAAEAASKARPFKQELASAAADEAANAAAASQESAAAAKAAAEAKAAEEARKKEEAKKAAEKAAADEKAKIASTKNLPMDHLVKVNPSSSGSGGTLVFQSGRVVHYKYAKQMTATAYNKDEPGLGVLTASGTHVRKGVVAVDKRVIPLGTRMYVVAKGYEYGYSVAEDTGVRGNVIDLYFESYKGMINFGRRSCTIYVLD